MTVIGLAGRGNAEGAFGRCSSCGDGWRRDPFHGLSVAPERRIRADDSGRKIIESAPSRGRREHLSALAKVMVLPGGTGVRCRACAFVRHPSTPPTIKQTRGLAPRFCFLPTSLPTVRGVFASTRCVVNASPCTDCGESPWHSSSYRRGAGTTQSPVAFEDEASPFAFASRESM